MNSCASSNTNSTYGLTVNRRFRRASRSRDNAITNSLIVNGSAIDRQTRRAGPYTSSRIFSTVNPPDPFGSSVTFFFSGSRSA